MSLFKYLTSDRLDVLENLSIRFTQPTLANDPFELQLLLGVSLGSKTKAELLNERLLDESLADLLGFPGDIITQAKENDPDTYAKFKRVVLKQTEELMESVIPNVVERFVATFSELVGILSLSETATESVMWAHYAANHSGFVLEFDEGHPWFHAKLTRVDELRHIRKVVYGELSKHLNLTDITADDALYRKLPSWEYEREWRMIKPLTDCTEKRDDVYLFAFPAECVTGVILGLRTDSEKIERLHNILRGNPRLAHVRTGQVSRAIGGASLVVNYE